MNMLKSRTIWTIVIMVALRTLQVAHEFISEELYLLLQSVLGAFAVYFRVNARV
jgi:hypothetical protein